MQEEIRLSVYFVRLALVQENSQDTSDSSQVEYSKNV